jgi:hypothetical protein
LPLPKGHFDCSGDRRRMDDPLTLPSALQLKSAPPRQPADHSSRQKSPDTGQ